MKMFLVIMSEICQKGFGNMLKKREDKGLKIEFDFLVNNKNEKRTEKQLFIVSEIFHPNKKLSE